MSLKQGTLLQGGKYRIERELGHGGFGITYLATQVLLNRLVAIKEFFMSEFCNRDAETLRVSVPSDGSREQVARFRNKFVKEAQNIAGLKNPHIIGIHDIFEENDTAYYVMEYLEQGSLADMVKAKGRLPEADALRYTYHIADALQYIHERQMNHLDVKPGNILVDESGNAVLIDFGLSKRYDEGGNQTSTTPVGISHGYAPLEQYRSGGVGTFSPTTDIYALGATLYKLIIGSTPPDANDINDDGLPELPSYVSPNVAEAIEKAMKPRRKERLQSVKEFVAILDKSVTTDKSDFLEVSVVSENGDNEATVVNLSQEKRPDDKQENKSENTIVADENPKKSNSIWRIRNWFVNVMLFVALLVDLFLFLLILIQINDEELRVFVPSVIGMAVGIIALLNNKRWGFYLTIISIAVAAIPAYLEINDSGYDANELYITPFLWLACIYIPTALVLFIHRKGRSAWAMLNGGNKHHWLILLASILLVFYSTELPFNIVVD